PISFTQNLFYLALSRLPVRQGQAVIAYIYLAPVVGTYCSCLLLAPGMAGGPGLINTIVVARLLLLLPPYTVEPATSSNVDLTEEGDSEQVQNIIFACACGCACWQFYDLAQIEVTGQDVFDG